MAVLCSTDTRQAQPTIGVIAPPETCQTILAIAREAARIKAEQERPYREKLIAVADYIDKTVIPEGPKFDEVLEIVPTGDRLIIEAKVSPKDIAYVRTGQTADLKFDAYDSSIFGSAMGKVTYISPDTLVEQAPGSPERPYYRVHIQVDTRRMKAPAGQKIQLQPGMTATAEIKTGDNTVLGYLMKPITKTISGSLTER